MAEPKQEPRFKVTDRRFWVEDESAIEKASIPIDKYPSFVEELKARTELAQQKLKEKVKTLDEENEAFRLRLSKEMERRLQREKFDFFQHFLEIVDNFERALQAAEETSSFEGLKEGVKLNLELFLSKLKSLGIEPLDVLHQPFNPHEAEAVGVVSVDDPNLDQHVVEVLQGGFRWGEQLLRAARVRIGQYQPSSKPQGEENKQATLSSESN
ncbi:nucleotide exchange factor GrpE [Acidobacteria bacterium AH-259-G07]|nr:nucleotide exchange factor GrpE [Acidobacteria bacterium AH-259-G07]